MADIMKNAIGVALEITVKENGVAVNISSATKIDVVLKKPSGTVVTKTGVLIGNGSDGRYKYVTVSGDLNESGRWQIQAHLVLAGFDGRSESKMFEVSDVL